MRRVWLVIASTVLVTAIGCGKANYEKRLGITLEDLKYQAQVKKNLMPKLAEKNFIDLAIYVQPPKEMVLTKTGQLPVSEGQFDLDASFNDKDAALHVLARVKLPKKPLAKGAVAPPPRSGDFPREVISVLTNVFGSVEKLETPKFVDESKGRPGRTPVKFKRLIFTANDKEIDVYMYKQDNHEVALIFVFDPKQKNALIRKIELCLENFATGPAASRRYNGGVEESSGEPSGPAGPM